MSDFTSLRRVLKNPNFRLLKKISEARRLSAVLAQAGAKIDPSA
jgi:hypothetical protein